MRTLQQFDPSLTAGGQITTQTVNPCSVVVLFNHSLFGITLTLPGGNTANLPPWYFRYYYLPIPGNMQWTKNFALTSTGPPVSLVTGEVYEPSEAEGRTFTEGPLPLAVNVGNTVSTTSGGSNTVQNDANPASTVFIEATQSGGPASNVSATVDGSIQFNQWDGATKKLLLQTIANAAVNNPAVKMLVAGMFAEIVGSLQVDQNIISLNNQPHQWKDTGGTARKVLQVDGSNNTQLYGITGLDLIQMLSSGGVLGIVFDMINKSLDIKTTSVQVVGTTNGTATLYEFLTGTNVKAFLIYFNAYRNASGVSQTIALPAAFTTWAQWLAGNAVFVTPRNGGSNLTNACRVLTTLASGGGSNTTTTLLPPKSLGEIVQGFDGFDLGNTQGTNNTSIYFFVGQ